MDKTIKPQEKATILIVNDEPIILKLIGDVLAKEGHEIYTADRGDNALKIINDVSIDILVTDIKMPEMDGVQFINEAKKIAPEILVIVITGFPEIDSAINLLKINVYDYIVKPMDPDDVMASVNRAWDRQRQNYENKQLIQDLKSANDLLQQREGRFRSLTENTSDWIWELDVNGVFTYSNPKAYDILGYRQEVIIGKTPFDFMSADEAQRVAGFFRETAQSGKPFSFFENTNVHKDGRHIIIETSGVPFLDKDGNLLGYRGVNRNITDRKQAEIERKQLNERLRESRESRESFQAIVNKNPGGIIIVNKKGIIKFVNPAAELLFRKKADELIGSMFGLPLANGDNEKMELDIITENGKTGTADMRVLETTWLGEPAYLATLFDVTAIKEAEENLIKTNEELINIAQMKTEFISIASHELRTPLTSIKNAVDILLYKKAGELNAKQEQFTAMAAHNIDRLVILLNDLLDTAKLDAGKVKLEFAELDPGYIFQKAVDTFKPQAEAKSQTLEIDYDSLNNIPTIYADYAKIQQVMNNLISNALKFTQEGGKVILSARAISDFGFQSANLKQGEKDSAIRNPQSAIEISVTDNGSGLSMDDQKMIFDKFYQAGHTLDQKSKGSGLGLNISRGLVKAHGGKLLVESEPGKGCRFFFTLPGFSPEDIEMSVLEIEISKLANHPPFSLLCLNLKGIGPLSKHAKGLKIHRQFLAQLKDVAAGVIRQDSDRIIMQKHFGRLIIILPGTAKAGAMIVRNKLKTAFYENPVFFDEQAGQVFSISMPVTFPEDGQIVKKLLKKLQTYQE